MKGFNVRRGNVYAQEDDPNDESKVPKSADDLRFPNYSLEMRQDLIKRLSAARDKLKIIENQYILTSENVDHSSYVKDLRTKIDMENKAGSDLYVKCEMRGCPFKPNKTPIYLNVCNNCNEMITPLLVNMLTLNNVLLYMSYLIEMITSSLSNQLTEDELIECTKKSDILISLI